MLKKAGFLFGRIKKLRWNKLRHKIGTEIDIDFHIISLTILNTLPLRSLLLSLPVQSIEFLEAT